MTSSPRRRRNSMDQPPSISNINNLKDELNRLHEKMYPECLKHMEKMSRHVNEFEKDYRNANILLIGGAVVGTASAIAGGTLCLFTAGVSAGIAAFIMATLAAAGVSAIGGFQKTYKEKDFRKTIETELDGFQKKISPIIDMIQIILIHTEKILRDPTLSENKANAIRERFSYLFEKMQLFQGHGNREVGDRMSKIALHFSGNLSEIVSEISSVLNVLEEILEGEVQESNVRPAETPRPKQIDGKLFQLKAEKFIVDMKKGIDQLKNVMNEIKQVKERISHNLSPE